MNNNLRFTIQGEEMEINEEKVSTRLALLKERHQMLDDEVDLLNEKSYLHRCINNTTFHIFALARNICQDS